MTIRPAELDAGITFYAPSRGTWATARRSPLIADRAVFVTTNLGTLRYTVDAILATTEAEVRHLYPQIGDGSSTQP